MTSELRIERVASPDAIRDEWGELAARSRNVFGTPEFHEAWWRHFGRGHDPALTACYDGDGALVAVLPLYVWRRRAPRVLRFAGHRAGDQLGPVHAQTDATPVARALLEVLEGSRADVLVLEQVLGDEGWGDLLRGQVLAREGNPVLPLDFASWDDYLATRSSNFRQLLRRRERKLEREHGLVLRQTDAERLDADLATLFELHARRWGETTNFLARRAFHEEFAHVAATRGWLRLWVLELEGKPAAAWYGFRYGDAESFYQSGRDPAWERLSVGLVVVAHSVRAALEDRVGEYRFLLGDEDYKYRFTDLDPGLEVVAVARGALGRGAIAGVRAARSVRRYGASARQASSWISAQSSSRRRSPSSRRTPKRGSSAR